MLTKSIIPRCISIFNYGNRTQSFGTFFQLAVYILTVCPAGRAGRGSFASCEPICMLDAQPLNNETAVVIASVKIIFVGFILFLLKKLNDTAA